MTGIRHKTTIDLDNIIAPHGILICDEGNYLFDKINMDEGRLYRFNNNWADRQLVMEIDNGECFFGRDGYIYILYTDDTSTVEVYDKSGTKIKDFSIGRVVYAIDVNEDGFIYCLVTENECMWVMMYDNNGNYLRAIHSRNMSLLTTMYQHDGYIYCAGFSDNISVRIEKINYLSYIDSVYELGDANSKFIVTKILKYGNLIIAGTSGYYGDSVYIIDERANEVSRYDTSKDGIQSISDMYIEDNNIFIISKGKKLASYDLSEITEDSVESKRVSRKKNLKRSSYGYIIYLICMKNLPKYFFNFLMKVSVPLVMLFMLYAEYSLKGKGIIVNNIERVRAFSLLSILTSMLCVVIRSIALVWKKRNRIDNMLDIYNRINTINRIVLRNIFIGGLITVAAMFSAFYKNEVGDAAALAITLLSGVCSSAFMYILYIKFINKFKKDMENTSFELLSLSSKDNELLEKIGEEVKRLRKLGIERYRIRFLAKKKTDKSVIKLVKKWCTLRKKIIGGTGKLENKGDCVVLDLNLKNRDIKYSRLSVIEDFICYLNNVINMSSVVIEVPDDKESSL